MRAVTRAGRRAVIVTAAGWLVVAGCSRGQTLDDVVNEGEPSAPIESSSTTVPTPEDLAHLPDPCGLVDRASIEHALGVTLNHGVKAPAIVAVPGSIKPAAAISCVYRSVDGDQVAAVSVRLTDERADDLVEGLASATTESDAIPGATVLTQPNAHAVWVRKGERVLSVQVTHEGSADPMPIAMQLAATAATKI